MMKKITFYFFIGCVVCIPSLVHGADFYFEQAKTLSSSGSAQIVLKIKTGQDRLNALSGKIEIPDSIEVLKVNTGSSAMLLWIDRPQIGKTIVFSGVTPGGFQGDVTVFSFEYTKKGSAEPLLKVSDVEAIKDDGSGTNVTATAQPFVVKTSELGAVMDNKDMDAPEPFDIAVGRSGDVFDGSYFASFVAQDKNSGIQQYQYAQTLIFSPSESDWIEVSSPLVLKNMALIKKISIKAIDGEGNIQISTVSGPYRYTVLWIGIIIILTLCALSFYVRRYSYRSS